MSSYQKMLAVLIALGMTDGIPDEVVHGMLLALGLTALTNEHIQEKNVTMSSLHDAGWMLLVEAVMMNEDPENPLALIEVHA